jgi:cytoskeletal protein CcmA (bactofilin family)
MSTTIGKGLVITGSLSATEPVSIGGVVTGDVTVMGGAVILEADGRVDGSITAREVDVHGRLSGRLIAAEIVWLHSSCNVRAEIASPKLAMDEGAIFSGRVEPGRAEAAMRVAAYRQAT